MITLLISFFWLAVFIKKLFFWTWLWQLKEYHLGRFRDHFRTHRGRKLVLNFWLFLKIAVFLLLVFRPNYFLIYPFLGIYAVETVLGFRQLSSGSLKIPVLTRKTSLILTTGISLGLLILSYLFSLGLLFNHFLAFLMGFDILGPVVFSLLVLFFQPLAVNLRNNILRKARQKREKLNDLLVIGVTGSYGKTSTKEFLAAFLAEKYKVVATEKHHNSEVGISKCLLEEVTKEHEVFVCEMGAYNRGGIKLLCGIAKPKIGILTGINEQHMATFGSQKNIVMAKFELISCLPEDGLAVLNYDDPRIRDEEIDLHNSGLKNVKYYSMYEKKDLWAQDIKVEKEGISFKVLAKDGDKADFHMNLLGIHNIRNVLAAVLCAKNLGLSLPEISKRAREIERWHSGMDLKNGISGLKVIEATYSANPSGVMAHLDYLKVWEGKKIMVMPSLIELGKSSKEVHRRIGEKMALVCDLVIITSKDRFKEIQEGAFSKGMSKENIVLEEDALKILEKIRDFADKGDVVLLESRVPRKLTERITVK